MEFEALRGSPLWGELSDRGRAMHLGAGIFHWVRRAREEAEVNGVIGVARGRESDVLPDGDPQKPMIFHLPLLREALLGASAGDQFDYASEGGLPALRDGWRSWLLRKAERAGRAAPRHCEPLIGRPLVSPGLTGALSTVLRLFLREGDPVVVPDRRWENYDLMVGQQLGGRLLEYETFRDQRWNTEGLGQALREAARTHERATVILNFPHNPTGYMPDGDTARRIRDALVEHAEASRSFLLVLFDDAYEGFVFSDDAVPCSLFHDLVGAHPRILPVKLDAVSKEFLFWGGRLGFITYAVHPEWGASDALLAELENKTRAMLRSSISTCVRMSQAAMVHLLQRIDDALQQRERVMNVLQRRVKRFREALRELPPEDFQTDPFAGGFFLLLNVAPRVPVEKLADLLLREHRIGLLPLAGRGINALRSTHAGIDESAIPRVVEAIGAAFRALARG